jgi:hypothetical protein
MRMVGLTPYLVTTNEWKEAFFWPNSSQWFVLRYIEEVETDI